MNILQPKDFTCRPIHYAVSHIQSTSVSESIEYFTLFNATMANALSRLCPLQVLTVQVFLTTVSNIDTWS